MMWEAVLVFVITVIVVSLFVFSASRWQKKRVKELYEDSATQMWLQRYNDSLDEIQKNLADQNIIIESVATNTYKKPHVDEMVDGVKMQMASSNSKLGGQIAGLEKEIYGRVHHNVAEATYAKKTDVTSKLDEYVRNAAMDNRLSEMDKYAADTYLPKSAATAMYVDKGKLFTMESDLGSLKNKYASLEGAQQNIFEDLPNYATKSDLSGYARYADYTTLSDNLGSHVRDANLKNETVSSFMAAQTSMNMDILNKHLAMQGNFADLGNKHEDLVNELGNYLTADAVNSLLQSSYAPLNSFNILGSQVAEAERNIGTLNKRTTLVENDIKLKSSQLCLADPVTKENVCMIGADFALLKDIMGQYYKNQEEDDARIQYLEQQRKDADEYMRKMEEELRIAEEKQLMSAAESAAARERLKLEADAKDKELSNQLTLAILDVKAQSEEARQELRVKLAEEQQKLESEKQRLAEMQEKMEGLTGQLESVQEQDSEQNKTIGYLKGVIEQFDEQKKKLNDTIREKSDIIQDLSYMVTMQEERIDQQQAAITVGEEQLQTCEVVRVECTNDHLPTCRKSLKERETEVVKLDADVTHLEGRVDYWEGRYNATQYSYDLLNAECLPKITQAQCDAQQRRNYQLTLYRNEEEMFRTDVIVRNHPDATVHQAMLDEQKDARVADFKKLWSRQNPADAKKLDGYPNPAMFYWRTTETECPDYSELIRQLEAQAAEAQRKYDACHTDLSSCYIDLEDYKAKWEQCDIDHSICKDDRKRLQRELEEEIRRRCKDCDYTPAVMGRPITGGLIDENTIKTFCYNGIDHLTDLQVKAGGGSWAPVDVMHKPNCKMQEVPPDPGPEWVKFHGYPDGMLGLSKMTVANRDACKVECDKNDACSLYVYNKALENDNCELKTSIPIFESYTPANE